MNGNNHTTIPKDLTINGNGATLVQTMASKNGEADIGIANLMQGDVTYTVNDLLNTKIWGSGFTDHTWTINLNNCDSSSENGVGNNGFVMKRSDTLDCGLVQLNVTGCDITSQQTAGGNNAIHTDRYVIATVKDCSFKDISLAININLTLTEASADGF